MGCWRSSQSRHSLQTERSSLIAPSLLVIPTILRTHGDPLSPSPTLLGVGRLGLEEAKSYTIRAVNKLGHITAVDGLEKGCPGRSLQPSNILQEHRP